jgi:NTP pyrophosphatase (non-canonical NTP hydrolase)
MDEQEYAAEVMRTYAGSDDVLDKLCLSALGLAGETGEVVDMVKKTLYQGHSIDVDRFVDELGDVLWYFALTCSALGLSIEQVMIANVLKLRQRYLYGFDPGRSVGR